METATTDRVEREEHREITAQTALNGTPVMDQEAVAAEQAIQVFLVRLVVIMELELVVQELKMVQVFQEPKD